MERFQPFPLIYLKGSSYEIGLQHGRALSTQIKDFAQKGVRFTSAYTPITLEEVKQLSRLYLQPIQAFSSSLAEELQGIADGSGVSIEEIIFLHIRAELMFRGVGCTTYALSGSVTREGQVISGQNLDWDPALEGLGVFLKIIPNHGPSALIFTYPGNVGYLGINSEGLSVGLNLLLTPGNQVGIPPYFLIRTFLGKGRDRDCLEVVRGTQRSSARNFMIADAKEDIVDLETTPDDFEIIDSTEGFLVHTNHFLTPKFAPTDLLLKDFPDSPIRLRRMEELLRENLRKITPHDLKVFLSDHLNHPFSICRHSDNTPKAMKTILSVIFEPERGILHAAKGNPCENSYFIYEL